MLHHLWEPLYWTLGSGFQQEIRQWYSPCFLLTTVVAGDLVDLSLNRLT